MQEQRADPDSWPDRFIIQIKRFKFVAEADVEEAEHGQLALPRSCGPSGQRGAF